MQQNERNRRSQKIKRRRQRQLRRRCITVFAMALVLIAMLTHLQELERAVSSLGFGVLTEKSLEKQGYPKSLIALYGRQGSLSLITKQGMMMRQLMYLRM